MAVKAAKKRNPAAVALARKGGKKAGSAGVPTLTLEQRNQSARINQVTPVAVAIDTSDQALLALLKRLKATNDPTEIRQLSNQVERVIFHQQYKNA